MKRSHATILMSVVGVLAFVGIVGLSLATWFFVSVFERETADEPAATLSFDDVRRRFPGEEPVLAIVEDREAVVRREPPASAPARPLERLQLLVWDPGDEGLSRVTLPFWLLRLKAGPLDAASRISVNDHRVNLTVEQIERYGPALLVDHAGRNGDRLLIWTE
jgi:hypothetical protein